MATADESPTDRRHAAIFLAIVSVALLLVALIRISSGDERGDTAVLPSVELTATGDGTVSTDHLLGQPLVINFWYSACPPCANELKHFAAIHEDYSDQVRFVGVNAIDTVEQMTDFAGERGVTYELFQDRLAELQTAMRLSSFPTTLFVDSDGTIVARTGVLDEAGLEHEVVALLARDHALSGG